MTVGEFLVHTSLSLRGIDEEPPTFGEEEATYWIALLNRKKNELYANARVLWDATWEVKSLGTISASATPSFNCDATLIAPSDQVYAVDVNSNKVYYDLTRPKERSSTKREFYLAGLNPQVLYCTNEIQSDEDIVTGTLYLPGYYMPADVSASDDDVPLPDPYWGVLAVASEVAFSDIVYEDKAGDLQAKANNLYTQMLRNNRRGTYENPKTIPHNHYRIRGTEVN